MSKKEFKTESKRLLDLMANSIYTNTDIFLRELISNASDALDKRYYLSLTDNAIPNDKLKIFIDVDKKNRTITIEDNGIGMNREDLEENLGTIAKSGSLEFKEGLDNKDIDIIGQFGVGFYSSFMVADRIEVDSLKLKEEKAYRWVSEDQDGYEIFESDKKEYGTTIRLHIKKNTREKKYDDYLDEEYIEKLIKKYSDYIRYPIEMYKDVTVNTEDNKKRLERQIVTVNSMIPLWKKSKKEISQDDYDEFYMNNFRDYLKPLKTIHYKVEGKTSYTALLYIPSKAPYDYYTADYKAGLKLYSKGVFIKDEAKELIFDHFRFVKGLVDSDDLSLNISREILQEDYQMTAIRKSVDKKVKSTLETMLEKERSDYETFFDAFGHQLKYGCYDNFGNNKDMLIDLLLFKSTKEDKYVTLKEYVSRMKEDQKEIYYAAGENMESIKEMPQMEKLLSKDIEVLYFTDPIDEFMTTIIADYEGHMFRSINKGDLDLDTKEEKEERKKQSEDNKELLDDIKADLGDKVEEVRLSTRLVSHPVCLVSDDQISMEMERTLNATNQNEYGYKAKKVLEINPDHPLFKALVKAHQENKDLSEYAKVLYDQALLIAGMNIEDPVEFSKRLSKMMIDSLN